MASKYPENVVPPERLEKLREDRGFERFKKYFREGLSPEEEREFNRTWARVPANDADTPLRYRNPYRPFSEGPSALRERMKEPPEDVDRRILEEERTRQAERDSYMRRNRLPPGPPGRPGRPSFHGAVRWMSVLGLSYWWTKSWIDKLIQDNIPGGLIVSGGWSLLSSDWCPTEGCKSGPVVGMYSHSVANPPGCTNSGNQPIGGRHIASTDTYMWLNQPRARLPPECVSLFPGQKPFTIYSRTPPGPSGTWHVRPHLDPDPFEPYGDPFRLPRPAVQPLPQPVPAPQTAPRKRPARGRPAARFVIELAEAGYHFPGPNWSPRFSPAPGDGGGPGGPPGGGSSPPDPPGGTIVPPFTDNRPPGRGVKERKSKMKARAALAFRLAAELTEADDIIEAMWKSLPRSVRKKVYQRYLSRGQEVGPWQRAKAVYENFDKLDLDQMYKNLVDNQLEDMSFGEIFKHTSKAFRDLGISGGQLPGSKGMI